MGAGSGLDCGKKRKCRLITQKITKALKDRIT